jgi:elongator complex protein 1
MYVCSLLPSPTFLSQRAPAASVLLTPFALQNVPPPACAHTLALQPAFASMPARAAPTPTHVDLAPHADLLSALFAHNARVVIYDLHTRTKFGRGAVVRPEVILDAEMSKEDAVWRALGIWTQPAGADSADSAGQEGTLGVLGAGADGRDVLLHTTFGTAAAGDAGAGKVRKIVLGEIKRTALDGSGWALVRGGGRITVCSNKGSVREGAPFPLRCFEPPTHSHTPAVSSSGTLAPVASLGRACERVEHVDAPATIADDSAAATNGGGGAFYVGLARGGALVAVSRRLQVPSGVVDADQPGADAPNTANGSTKPFTLATNATSFAVTTDFVIYTTTAHEAHFVPLGALAAALAGIVDAIALSNSTEHTTSVTSERRRVERGARIVAAVPAATALVLQMPRGNLETVYPRPMVMAVVRADILRFVLRAHVHGGC